MNSESDQTYESFLCSSTASLGGSYPTYELLFMGYHLCDSKPNSNDAPKRAEVAAFTLLMPLNKPLNKRTRFFLLQLQQRCRKSNQRWIATRIRGGTTSSRTSSSVRCLLVRLKPRVQVLSLRGGKFGRRGKGWKGARSCLHH